MKKTIIFLAGVAVVAMVALVFDYYFCKAGWCAWPIKEGVVKEDVLLSYGAIHLYGFIANSLIESPLQIKGEAPGAWFFEAVFPIRLMDSSGKEIGRTHTNATADWMTINYVPFTATLTFTEPTTATGTLVFAKDNPSGLTGNAGEVDVPVVFATN